MDEPAWCRVFPSVPGSESPAMSADIVGARAPEAQALHSAQTVGSTGTGKTSEITIYFFYTQQFEDQMASGLSYGSGAAARKAGVTGEVEKSVALTNEAFRNSGVNARLVMVGIEKSLDLPDSVWKARDWIRDSAYAKAVRNARAADLVYALIDDDNRSYGGYACRHYPQRYGWQNDFNRDDCFMGMINSLRDHHRGRIANWRTILRHEVGHNLGLQHPPEEIGGGPRDSYPGGRGYRSPSSWPGRAYGTVMSQLTVVSQRVSRFSSSTERWRDLVIGKKGIHEASSVLRQTVGYVSEYRFDDLAVPKVTWTRESLVAVVRVAASTAFGQEVVFNVAYGGAADTAVGASNPARADYDNDAVTSVTFSPTDTSKTFLIPITDDKEDEDGETFTVTLVPAEALPEGFSFGNMSTTVSIADDDHSPLLRPIDAVQVRVGETVDVRAHATDWDGDAISYRWTRKAGETVPALPAGTRQNRARLRFTPPGPGVYTMTVRASDRNGNVDREEVVITVGTVAGGNSPPVLAPLTDRTVKVGQTVDITAAATDADNDAIGYAWTRDASETSPAIPGGTALDQARLTFRASAVGTYTMTVTASDGNGNSDTEEVVVTVGSADTVSLSSSLSVAESAGSATVRVTVAAALGRSVTFTLTYGGSATGAASPGDGDDYDNDAVTLVTFGPADTAKAIAIPIRDDGLDEDSETIEVTIAVADGGTLPAGFELGATTTTVTITDDDESPVLSRLADRTVKVGQTVDITAVATDGDNDTIGYAWTRDARETSPAIPGGTALDQARLTFTASAVGTYTMTVTASDGNGNSDTEEVVVTVRPADPVGDDSGGGDGSPGGNPGSNDGNDGGGTGGNDGSSGGGPGPPDDPGGNDGGNGAPGGNNGSDGGPAGADNGPGGNSGGPGFGGGSGGGGTNDDDGAADDGDDDDDRGGPGGNDDDSGDGDWSGDAGGAVRASFTLDAPCADGLCRARTGVRVSFRDTSSGAVTSRTWNLGDGATSGSRSLEHAWSVPGFYTVSLRVSGRGPSSTVSRKVLVVAADPVGTCAADGETLCLQDSRFSVKMDWWTEDGTGGRRGAGKVVREGTNDSGLFWFFSAVNWELLVKVLDGCSVNGRMWVYGASATTLGYSLTVTDTVTGAAQEYRNEPGRQAEAFTDSAAFPGSCTDTATAAAAAAADASALPLVAEPLPEPAPAVHHLAVATVSVAAPAEDDVCTDTATAMCLQRGRYEVTVAWSNLDGMSGKGRTAGPRTDDSGLFHFFSPANWEILVKVLDGCSFNDHHWVFAASATDVGFDLRVRDTATGRTRRYTRQPGKPARALVDISAFPHACQRR